MKAGSRETRTLLRVAGAQSQGQVCLSCRQSASRRTYASAAAAVSEAEDVAVTSGQNDRSTAASATGVRPVYRLHAGVVLSRPPQITRDLHPFEKAFFLYQRRLNERLALPFTRYFYFKKGTPADLEWKRKIKERLTPARDIGIYNAYSKEGWADEVKIGAKESEPQHQMDMLIRDAEAPAPVVGSIEPNAEPVTQEASTKKIDVERPKDRITAADQEGNLQSLDRQLQKNIYLLVKDEAGRWRFPSAQLLHDENLHEAAERIIVESGGPNMNTWVVGNAPVGHFAVDYPKAQLDSTAKRAELGEKVFFMKSRIMAGQANIQENKFGLSEFRWLAKDEIKALVGPKYWSMVETMLTDR